MKKILITGANSYIGMSFEKYIKTHYADKYTVETMDMIDGSWREKSFAGYDSVFHVAGIAHQKETKKNAYLYYEINRDLAFDTAKKAKQDGVKQFVFLSSMSVYGIDTGVITKETIPLPKSNYGKSKLEAEKLINTLIGDDFKVAILRPPMVYGRGCKGNFQAVLKIVKTVPVFPYVSNERSMIYIDNLCAFVRILVDGEYCGMYYPQNKEYMETSIMARYMARAMKKRLLFTRLGGLGIVIVRPFVKRLQKAFGTLIYKDTEAFDYNYCIVDNEESVRKSV